jgi:adenosylhomocysteine nucleosidase
VSSGDQSKIRSPSAPAPVPADIGIVAALPIEVGDFIRRLTERRIYHAAGIRVTEGWCHDRLVCVITPGIGRTAARKGAERLLAGHHPRWLISTGFAGALDPTLRLGDVILPTEVLDPEHRRLSIGLDFEPTASVRAGRVITVDQVIRTAAEKQKLREHTGADLVDMETAELAELAAARQIRFLAVRVISDTADQELPPEVISILGPSGAFRLGVAIGAIARRPKSLGTMLHLREIAHNAAHRLAQSLAQVIAQLG